MKQAISQREIPSMEVLYLPFKILPQKNVFPCEIRKKKTTNPYKSWDIENKTKLTYHCNYPLQPPCRKNNCLPTALARLGQFFDFATKFSTWKKHPSFFSSHDEVEIDVESTNMLYI